MRILLAGNGKMASEVAKLCLEKGIVCSRFGTDAIPSRTPHTVAIHFGSGRELATLIKLCEERHHPLIQGSTKVEVPVGHKMIIVNAPNLAIPMIALMRAFPAFAKDLTQLGGMDLCIAESHQSKKTDVSGTARAVAKEMGMSESGITPIRNPAIQMALGVPEENLGGHAYHYFAFTGHGVKISVNTEILGRRAYAEGALLLAKALLQKHLALGTHDLSKVVQQLF